MNWSKAKSVLLVALLVTDLFLAGIVVMDHMRLEPEENAPAFHRETESILRKNGITLAAPIPKDGLSLPVLDVAFESDTTENWNRRFFKGGGRVLEDGEQLLTIQREDEALHVIDNRRLLYEAGGGNARRLDQKEAEGVAEAFLRARGFAFRDMSLVTAKREGSRWRLVYTMRFHNRYVESTYTELDIEGDQVVRMDRLWIRVMGDTGEKKPLPLASQSLLRLIGHERLKGRRIEEIAPCHYFNPEEQGAVENLTHASRGHATVAWRMVLDGGEELVLLK